MKIVSALITDINRREDRNIDKYINYGKILIHCNHSMILFLESYVLDNYKLSLGLLDEYIVGSGSFYYHIDDTYQIRFTYIDYNINGQIKRVVLFEKQYIYLYYYRNYATKFFVVTENVHKDTLEYMFVQCHKTEWMKMSLACNPVVEDHVWLDFGIFHMFANNQPDFYHKLDLLKERNTTFSDDINRVRFASCWEPNLYYCLDMYKDIHWLFAGSVFGGSPKALTILAKYMREMCIQILKEKSTLMWEVNVWALLYKSCPNLFEFYKCNHDGTILGVW